MSAIVMAALLWCAPTTLDREIECREIATSVEIAAEYSGHDAWRLLALATKESGLRNDRVGKLGECGSGQVMGWFLDPPMTCAELQTSDGGQIGVIRALDQWRRARPEADPWQCYASGRICAAPRAMRRLAKIERELRALIAPGGDG